MDDERLRTLLTGGPVWGAELDVRFRVLAVTVEPPPDVHPDPTAGDRRVQLLFHPVSAVAASLVQATDDGPTVLRFGEDQLPEVVAALGGPPATGDPLPPDAPDVEALVGRLSLHGQATTGDGTLRHLHLHLEADDLTLDLWASFDEVDLQGPDGVPLVTGP